MANFKDKNRHLGLNSFELTLLFYKIAGNAEQLQPTMVQNANFSG